MAAIDVPRFQFTPWYEPDRVAEPAVAGERRREQRRPRATQRQVRRRRFVVLVALAAVVVVAALTGAMSGGDVTTAGTARSVPDGASAIVGDVYVVQPGDSLWSIAERLTPGGDPRPVVRELRERHGGVELNVGDRVPIDGLTD